MKTKILLASLVISCVLSGCRTNDTPSDGGDPQAEAAPVTFNADSAYLHIERQCAFGPRVPGSKAHADCASYIQREFGRYGLSVTLQHATVTAWDGKNLPCLNITASYLPDSARRIVIATHWDSRPWADHDPDEANHRTPVLAANDGASGVAVMLEVARQLAELRPTVGIDFVCFDVEDYGAPTWAEGPADGSDWCLGSRYWSTHLPDGYRPLYGILLDMVGGADARFRFEYFSRRYAEAVLAKVWGCAVTAGASDYFLAEGGMSAMDDHIPMNEQARIPTIDIIADNGNGFAATWHTVGDTPQNISRHTLKAVGQTLLQVLFEEK